MCDEVDVEMSRLRLYLGRKVLPSHTPRTIQMRDRGVGVTHTRYNPLADYNAVPHPIKKQIVAKSCDSRAGCAPRSGEMMDGFHRPERWPDERENLALLTMERPILSTLMHREQLIANCNQ
jgi:hypothetical protein